MIESESLTMIDAENVKKVTDDLGINFIHKSPHGEANSSGTGSLRGLGAKEGLRILKNLDEIGVPVLTVLHEDAPFV